MGQDIKTFKFSRNSVLCEDHFHKDCIKRNLMYEHFNMKPGKKELVEGAVPTVFANQIFDQINIDGTKVLLNRHVSGNKRKRDAEKDHPITSYRPAHFIVVQRSSLRFLVNFKFPNVTRTRIQVLFF